MKIQSLNLHEGLKVALREEATGELYTTFVGAKITMGLIEVIEVFNKHITEYTNPWMRGLSQQIKALPSHDPEREGYISAYMNIKDAATRLEIIKTKLRVHRKLFEYRSKETYRGVFPFSVVLCKLTFDPMFSIHYNDYDKPMIAGKKIDDILIYPLNKIDIDE